MPPCEVCGEDGVFMCSRCSKAHYCNAEHQRQDWKVHKVHCTARVAGESSISSPEEKARASANAGVTNAVPLPSTTPRPDGEAEPLAASGEALVSAVVDSCSELAKAKPAAKAGEPNAALLLSSRPHHEAEADSSVNSAVVVAAGSNNAVTNSTGAMPVAAAASAVIGATAPTSDHPSTTGPLVGKSSPQNSTAAHSPPTTRSFTVAGVLPKLNEGMCLYLNLDRRTDRRKSMEALTAPHRWLGTVAQRLPAVDGRELAWPQLVADKLFLPEAEMDATRAVRMKQATLAANPQDCSPHLTLGGCGCALSHRKAWQTLVDSDSRWALIFEDDLTEICDKFDVQLSTVIQRLPSAWQFCYIGFHSAPSRQMLRKGQSVTGPLLRLRPSDGWLAGLWGYLVTRECARHLLQTAVPFACQVDMIVGCIAAASGHGYALPPGQFLAFSMATEVSRDTDVQTFPEEMR